MPVRKKIDYPELFDKGKSWYIQWYSIVDGEKKRIRKSRWEGIDLNSFSDPEEKKRAAAEMLHLIKMKVCPPPPVPSEELFLEALQLALAIKRSPRWRTNKGYAENVRWLSEFFQKKGWQYLKCKDLSFEYIQAYFDHMVLKLRIANSTHNSRKNNLRALTTVLVKRGYLKENFFSMIEEKRVSDPIRRPLTHSEKEVIKIEVAKDPALTLAFILLGYLGIRPGEMRDLKVGHVNLHRGIVQFPASQSKNNRNSTVTIPDKLVPKLEAYGFDNYPKDYFLFGGGMGRHNKFLRPGPKRCGVNTLSNKFRTMVRRLKAEGKLHDLTGVQFYSLKDTLALYLLDNGVDPHSAMEHFRQNDLRVFQRYVKRLGQINEKVKSLPVDF